MRARAGAPARTREDLPPNQDDVGLLVGWSNVVEVAGDRVRMVGADGVGRKFWRKPLPQSRAVWDAVPW